MSRKLIERRDDMSRTGRLQILQQTDGDMIISLFVDDSKEVGGMSGGWVSVEFCTHGGGGRSPNTWAALIELAKAVEKDNQERPIEMDELPVKDGLMDLTRIEYNNDGPTNLPEQKKNDELLLYGIDWDGQPFGPILGNWDSVCECWSDSHGYEVEGSATHFVIPPKNPNKGYNEPTVNNEVI